jgi:uncharacterized protein YwqG
MEKEIEDVFEKLEASRRKASIAQIGGFRPPESLVHSWFGGQGVGLSGEELPKYKGKEMSPLMQVKVDELPHVPDALGKTKFLVVFFNREEIPFDQENGNGWLIREYDSIEGLVPLPKASEGDAVKDFPIKWKLSDNEGPGWEDAWGVTDLGSINESEEASDLFFDRFLNHSGTKFGGWPSDIQHGLGGDGEFVFQIGSEEKPRWMWADNGIGYFLKEENGDWSFQCQFY